MNDIQTKFRQLLRDLFQFDRADLDFGLYRIMNHKRAVNQSRNKELRELNKGG